MKDPSVGDAERAAAEQMQPSFSVRQAAFIGVGAMVGAGIFALLGAAGEVAGAAVWISFLLAGSVAGLQGYSFAKLGARYPSAGGLLEYVVRGFGDGHFTGLIAWLLLAVNAIITAMVAVSFGSYASAAVADGGTAWVEALRGAGRARDDRAEHPRLQAVAAGTDRGRRRGRRHPHRVRGRDAGRTWTPTCWRSRATRPCGTSSPAWR